MQLLEERLIEAHSSCCSDSTTVDGPACGQQFQRVTLGRSQYAYRVQYFYNAPSTGIVMHCHQGAHWESVKRPTELYTLHSTGIVNGCSAWKLVCMAASTAGILIVFSYQWHHDVGLHAYPYARKCSHRLKRISGMKRFRARKLVPRGTQHAWTGGRPNQALRSGRSVGYRDKCEFKVSRVWDQYGRLSCEGTHHPAFPHLPWLFHFEQNSFLHQTCFDDTLALCPEVPGLRPGPCLSLPTSSCPLR